MKTLADRLKEERDARGWTQPELANRAKIAQSFVGALEAGNQKSSGWLPEIAHALGVDAYWLKTGLGRRLPGAALSPDEQVIINGFRLLGDEMREAWLDQAQKKIAQAEAAKNKAA